MEPRRENSGPAVSPGLYRGEVDLPAFESKFLLTSAEAAEVERRLRTKLSSDPHADSRGGYRVTTVYFDTPAFDVFHKADGFRKRKFRVRRYGEMPTAFLERKSRTKQKVRKRRSQVAVEELRHLDEADEAWPGHWFAHQLAKRSLRPVCRVGYDRTALIGTGGDGPIRATFDRDAVGVATTSAMPDVVDAGRPLLDGGVIVEFKFVGAMPSLFKAAVADLKLATRPVSKFRRCLEATGQVPGGRDDG